MLEGEGRKQGIEGLCRLFHHDHGREKAGFLMRL